MDLPGDTTEQLLRDFQQEHRRALEFFGEEGFDRAVEESLIYLRSCPEQDVNLNLPQALTPYLKRHYGRHGRAVGVIVLAMWLERQSG